MKIISHPTSVKIINWFLAAAAKEADVKLIKMSTKAHRTWYYVKDIEEAQVLIRTTPEKVYRSAYRIDKEQLNILLEAAERIVNY